MNTSEGDRLAAKYFELQTQQLSQQSLADIETLEDWTSRREMYRQQLLDMLGLNPMPARSELHTTITGEVRKDDVIVEKLHFQSLPGLYVTANLYRPAEVEEPLPAVLYVCAHGRVVENGISYGNKVHYQHHGAWFARNGYVCLVIDTIQLGEIEGIHHGTYREKMWWWNNRGYTPAGVEAWNSMRAVDLLQSRPEVDPERIGVTGRSGGGAYSWWLAAIDERFQAAVPVAGITTLENHVVDGCVSGHCDCMYMVNTYRWDFPMVAALVAPRPLLISNTDRDSIFPLDGVVDLHAKVRKIYELYGAEKNLGLQITSGPHQDTQELRIHAFRWLNRHLRGDESLIEKVATKLFEPKQLKVFAKLPEDERVTTIHETFVPQATAKGTPQTTNELAAAAKDWKQKLRTKTFAGWPQQTVTPDLKVVSNIQLTDANITFAEYSSQPPYRLPLVVLRPNNSTDAARSDSSSADDHVDVVLLDQSSWERAASGLAVVSPERFAGVQPDAEVWKQLATSGRTTVLVAPRGVGPTEWSRDERDRTHIRRRFMLLGQTAAGMQVHDVVRALEALNAHQDRLGVAGPWNLIGSGDAAFLALHASLWSDSIARLQLTNLPTSNRESPDLLNVSRVVDLPQIVMMATGRVPTVVIDGDTKPQWQQQSKSQPLLNRLNWGKD
ncbi:MAG: alpha/beta hydrolase [Rhodopirellula sp. JB055]|uniref:alpha/beta hydrolase n=1 Tax=Rhodopirellula sp. JB055 TaxID=3342846 RepID=UPI00370C6501